MWLRKTPYDVTCSVSFLIIEGIEHIQGETNIHNHVGFPKGNQISGHQMLTMIHYWSTINSNS